MNYVEGLKYYQDTPDRNTEKEAITIDRTGDDYYRPFFTNPKKISLNVQIPISICPTFNDPYSCLDNNFCTWDSSLIHCYLR